MNCYYLSLKNAWLRLVGNTLNHGHCIVRGGGGGARNNGADIGTKDDLLTLASINDGSHLIFVVDDKPRSVEYFWTPMKNLVAIICGMCVCFASMAQSATFNPDFDLGTSGWTFQVSGINVPFSVATTNLVTIWGQPDGTNFAYFQGDKVGGFSATPGVLSQTFSVSSNGYYFVRFFRSTQRGWSLPRVVVNIDKKQVGAWPYSGSPWSSSGHYKTSNTYLTAGSHVITIALGGDGNNFGNRPVLDSIQLFPTNVVPHTLTVNNGTGTTMNATVGTILPISANPAVAGKRFYSWTGDTARISNVNDASTYVTMPTNSITVTANFIPLPSTLVNVTNFGAKGDLLTLTNISVVSNSTEVVCSSANFQATDTNKLIEVWNAGTFRSVSNETLVAVITNVASPTAVSISIPAGRTANGLAGVYGTDNRPAFAAAIASCATPTATVIIPSGNYLLIETNVNDSWVSGVVLRRGGITFEGEGNAILTGQGGWRDNRSGNGVRGTLFQMLSPMTNDYALTWSNLTFYGGTKGWDGGGANGPNPTTGEGWDITHHAIAYWSTVPYVQLTSTNNIFNCTFHGWRGEMIISGLSIQSGLMTASNCVFYDGDATAFNMNMPHDWDNCTISNTFQVEEFYRDYATNASIIRNCTIKNLYGAYGIVMNGSYYGCPTYTISNNVMDSPHTYFMGTTPACDVLAVSNRIVNAQGGFALGIAGYQCTYGVCNSNIVIQGNSLTNVYTGLSIQGAGPNMVREVQVLSNTFVGGNSVANGYGWSTNVLFSGNKSSSVWVDGSDLKGQYFIDTNNVYPPRNYWASPGTCGAITYASGSFGSVGNAHDESFYLDDAVAKIPAAATITISNWASVSYPIYLSSAQTGSPFVLNPSVVQTFYWNGSVWQTNAPVAKKSTIPAPPTLFRILN